MRGVMSPEWRYAIITMVSWIPWSEAELQIIAQNFNPFKSSKSCLELSKALNMRSPQAIRKKAFDMGLCKKQVLWSETDTQVLTENFDSTAATTRKLSKILGRSSSAIHAKAYTLGLCRQERAVTRRPWTKNELDLLEELAGVIPVRQIVFKMKALCVRNGWSVRSREAICIKIGQLQLSRAIDGVAGDYCTSTAIATACKCSRHLVLSWFKDKTYAGILKPQRVGEEGSPYLVRRSNLAKFFIAYPGELNRVRPDMVWLVDLLVSKD